MKLYELMRVIDPRDKDLPKIDIGFWCPEEEDWIPIPTSVRSMVRLADVEVLSLDADYDEERGTFMVITVAEKPEKYIDPMVFKYKKHLLQ